MSLIQFLKQPGNTLFILFLLMLFIQLYYWLRFYLPLVFHRKKNRNSVVFAPVSVVVPLYHYDEDFFKSLELILQQNYDDYEVIVINVDTNLEVENRLSELQRLYGQLKLTFLPEKTIFSKKVALTLGVKAASYEWLLFLDSSCLVCSHDWLKAFGLQMADNKDVVVGYGNNKRFGGGWNYFLRIERFLKSMYCLSLTKAGYPRILEGRNVAFRKKLFFEHKGYAGLLNQHYAENELLMPRFVTRENVGLVIDKESVIEYDEYIRFVNYRDILIKYRKLIINYGIWSILQAGVELISRIGLSILAVVLIVRGIWTEWVVEALIFYGVLQLFCLKLLMNRLAERNLFLSSLLYNVLFPFISIVGRFIGLFKTRSSK